MQIYQANALKSMFLILKNQKLLTPSTYYKGEPAVVIAVFNYFDNLLTGGNQKLRLIALETVLEIKYKKCQCKITLYKSNNEESFIIGNILNLNQSTPESTALKFFSSVIKVMVNKVGFENAIDENANYKAQLVLGTYQKSPTNHKIVSPNIKFKKKRVFIAQ